MTTLDLTPRPGAAPSARRVWNHGLIELLVTVRNGEQLILALLIPAGILIAGALFGVRFGMPLDIVAPSVLALALWSTAFTSLAIQTGFERRYGVLERLAATPLRRSGLLAGKVLGVGLTVAGQWVILGALAVALGWRPHPDPLGTLVAVVAVVLAVGAFSGAALAMSGTLRAEATLGLANVVYLVGLVAGGIAFPVSSYPGVAAHVVALLPTAAVSEVLRGWSAGSVDPIWLLVLVVWAAGALLLARKVFRWTS